MLRAEFVASHQQPLSSDSFSSFPRGDDVKQCEANIKEATLQVRTISIRNLGQFVTRISSAYSENEKPPEIDVLNLSRVMHEYGINMRYLGLLYTDLTS